MWRTGCCMMSAHSVPTVVSLTALSHVLQKVAAQKVSISEAELESRLTSLVKLLPDIEHRVGFMKVERMLKLMDEKEAVAQRLLDLKLIFPSAGAQPSCCTLLLSSPRIV